MAATTDTKDTQARLDAILETDVVKGYIIKSVPDDIRADIKEGALPDVPRVRFSRLNPARRRVASEIVQRAYQRDLKNRDILSNAEVLKLVQDRGEWGPDKEARLTELQEQINKLMVDLYSEGIATDVEVWGAEVMELAENTRALLQESENSDEDKEALIGIFNRWVEYHPDKRADYTEKFAASQKREQYLHSHDFGKLMDQMAAVSVEAMNDLNKLDDRLSKIRRFVQLTELRKEQAELQVNRAKIFSDTVEARRDHNEELARLYVTCEKMAEEGEKPLGALAANFDDLFNYPDSAIKWFVEEAYMFHAGIPDEAREYLSTYGFLRAERNTSGEQPQSAESLAPESSKIDSPAVTETVSTSSESPAVTT